MDYNYADFDYQRENKPFAPFRNTLHVGEVAPSFSVEDLATGERIDLRSLWRKEVAVIEFGSLT